MPDRVEVELRRMWCPDCGGFVAARKNTPDSAGWGCLDGILVLVTLGIWIPIKLALLTARYVARGRPRWLCPTCGMVLTRSKGGVRGAKEGR